MIHGYSTTPQLPMSDTMWAILTKIQHGNNGIKSLTHWPLTEGAVVSTGSCKGLGPSEECTRRVKINQAVSNEPIRSGDNA